jgi:toxin YoeB
MKSVRSLIFDPNAIEDLSYWVQNDKRKAEKILKLIREILKDPFDGVAKPEPLKYELAGSWSRRIDQEHRLVYEVNDEKIRIVSCRYHYE